MRLAYISVGLWPTLPQPQKRVMDGLAVIRAQFEKRRLRIGGRRSFYSHLGWVHRPSGPARTRDHFLTAIVEASLSCVVCRFCSKPLREKRIQPLYSSPSDPQHYQT